MPSLTRISQLVQECLSSDGYYVNLDTGRKNKSSTMEKKKDLFLNEHFKVFSKSEQHLQSYIVGLQIIINSPNLIPNSEVSNQSRGILSDQLEFADEIEIDTVLENNNDDIIPWVNSYKNDFKGKDESNQEYYPIMNLFSTVNRLLIAPLLAE